MNHSAVIEKLEGLLLKIDNIFYLGGFVSFEFPFPDNFIFDFFDNHHPERTFKGIISDEALAFFSTEIYKEGDCEDEIKEWIHKHSIFGFLLHLSTPVLDIYDPEKPEDEQQYDFSWGTTYHGYVYGETIEEALERAYKWHSEKRKVMTQATIKAQQLNQSNS